MSVCLKCVPSGNCLSVQGIDCYGSLQRMDLGDCPKIHELALRADYEQAAKERDYGYVVDVSIIVRHFV